MKMRDLFGDPERWSQTLRSLLWTHVSVIVPSFQGSTLTDLPIPCTFDFNVAATKYFEGLADGEIPLHLMFSGTVFYADSEDVLQVAPISWEQEARFRLPVKVWREMMDAYYPNNVWLNLRAMYLIASINTKRNAESQLGSRHWRACCRWRKW